MKLKQDSDDFQVEELTGVVPAERGPYAFYQLEKSGWTTLDALQAIRRRWNLGPHQVSYGGLKDRHAHTRQYLTILHGPRRGLRHQTVTLSYRGQVARPYSAHDIRANRFRIVARAVDAEELRLARAALQEIRVDGVPNYFDNQRFGSVGDKQEFVARFLIRGEYETALRLALAATYRHDRGQQKVEKAVLQAHWGDWVRCKVELPRGHVRSLVDYLVHHPADFRGAFARMRPELAGLYLSAYQSHLWNRMLAAWLQGACRPDQLVRMGTRLGDLSMLRGLDESQRRELSRLSLPLPSARLHLEPADPRRAIVDAVLAEEGFPLSEMKLRGLRKPFFSRGDRPALCLPAAFNYQVEDDEKHAGRWQLILEFELPRGSYATLISKRLQLANAQESEEDDSAVEDAISE
jgi:tRNA pseudouridine13 synthase